MNRSVVTALMVFFLFLFFCYIKKKHWNFFAREKKNNNLCYIVKLFVYEARVLRKNRSYFFKIVYLTKDNNNISKRDGTREWQRQRREEEIKKQRKCVCFYWQRRYQQNFASILNELNESKTTRFEYNRLQSQLKQKSHFCWFGAPSLNRFNPLDHV